jgi:branched-chain amino acid transport system substrate-binding protein
MNRKTRSLSVLGVFVLVSSFLPPAATAEDVQYFPIFVFRTGPFAPSGIPSANASRDFAILVNKRDGGINGVKLVYEECETQYNTKLGIECYEKLKGKGSTGATIINPASTGLTYQLIPKSAVDKIPILTMGYGRTAAADGRVFKWVFNFPTTYWSQASAFIRYVGREEGGLDKLADSSIALIYHNSAYGKEPIPVLEALREKYGYALHLIAVDHPGQEQKAAWLQIRRHKPDWVFLWGFGVMNQVAVKEAAANGFPMDRMLGVWWSGTESDVVPAGDAAIGYKAGTFHAPGSDFPLFQDIVKYVYDGDYEEAKRNHWGEVLYNRTVLSNVYSGEAVRTAMARWGNKPMTGEQVRWGLENLHVTRERLAELGLAGFANELEVTCEDHESGGSVIIQQWNGKKWNLITDWIEPMHDVVRPMIEKAAAEYAKENNITPRDCSKADG